MPPLNTQLNVVYNTNMYALHHCGCDPFIFINVYVTSTVVNEKSYLIISYIGETLASCIQRQVVKQSVYKKHSTHVEIPLTGTSTVVGWKSTSRHTVQ